MTHAGQGVLTEVKRHERGLRKKKIATATRRSNSPVDWFPRKQSLIDEEIARHEPPASAGMISPVESHTTSPGASTGMQFSAPQSRNRDRGEERFGLSGAAVKAFRSNQRLR
jgi:hypothetical protein